MPSSLEQKLMRKCKLTCSQAKDLVSRTRAEWGSGSDHGSIVSQASQQSQQNKLYQACVRRAALESSGGHEHATYSTSASPPKSPRKSLQSAPSSSTVVTPGTPKARKKNAQEHRVEGSQRRRYSHSHSLRSISSDPSKDNSGKNPNSNTHSNRNKNRRGLSPSRSFHLPSTISTNHDHDHSNSHSRSSQRTSSDHPQRRSTSQHSKQSSISTSSAYPTTPSKKKKTTVKKGSARRPSADSIATTAPPLTPTLSAQKRSRRFSWNKFGISTTSDAETSPKSAATPRTSNHGSTSIKPSTLLSPKRAGSNRLRRSTSEHQGSNEATLSSKSSSPRRTSKTLKSPTKNSSNHKNNVSSLLTDKNKRLPKKSKAPVVADVFPSSLLTKSPGNKVIVPASPTSAPSRSVLQSEHSWRSASSVCTTPTPATTASLTIPSLNHCSSGRTGNEDVLCSSSRYVDISTGTVEQDFEPSHHEEQDEANDYTETDYSSHHDSFHEQEMYSSKTPKPRPFFARQTSVASLLQREAEPLWPGSQRGTQLVSSWHCPPSASLLVAPSSTSPNHDQPHIQKHHDKKKRHKEPEGSSGTHHVSEDSSTMSIASESDSSIDSMMEFGL